MAISTTLRSAFFSEATTKILTGAIARHEIPDPQFFNDLQEQKKVFDTDLSLILDLTSDLSFAPGIKTKKRFLKEVGKTGEITTFIKSQLTKKPIEILSQNFGIEIKTDSKTFSMSKYASVGVEFGINFDINWEYYSIRSDRINFFQQFQMDCWISAVQSRRFEIIRWIFSKNFYRFVLYILVDNYWDGVTSERLSTIKNSNLLDLKAEYSSFFDFSEVFVEKAESKIARQYILLLNYRAGSQFGWPKKLKRCYQS